MNTIVVWMVQDLIGKHVVNKIIMNILEKFLYYIFLVYVLSLYEVMKIMERGALYKCYMIVIPVFFLMTFIWFSYRRISQKETYWKPLLVCIFSIIVLILNNSMI